MIKLTFKELEKIVESAEDPLIKAKNGMELFSKEHPNPDALIRYAEIYMELMIQGGEKVKSEYKSRFSSGDPASEVLKHLPEKRAKELAKTYTDKKIQDFREQSPENPVDLSGLKRIIEKYSLSNPTYDTIMLVNEIIDPPLFDKKEIPKDKIQEVMKEAQSIVYNAHANGKIMDVMKVLHDQRFQKHHSQDEKIRNMAAEILEINLKSEYHLDLEKIKEFKNTYQIKDVHAITGRAVIYHLSEGRLEQAELVAKEFGYSISDKDRQAARKTIKNKLEAIAKQGHLVSIIDQKRLLKRFDQYKRKGLKQEDVPQVVLPEGYRGKIILAEFNGKTYLRGNSQDRDAGHKQILVQFNDELKSYGFNAGLSRYHGGKGGAYLIFRQDGSIEISDSSVDLGECDKEEAKRLVASVYKKRQITAKPADKNRF